jgi:hypothetical protein
MEAVRWLTYEEVAEALGIGRESARVTVKRKRWPRRPGNDRKIRIGVPEELIATRNNSDNSSDNRSGADTPTDPEHDPQQLSDVWEQRIEALEARLDGEIAGLRAIIEAERRRADLAESLVAEVRGDRDRWYAEATARRSWWPWRRRGAHV